MSVARVGHRLSRQASQRVEAEIAVEAIARYRAKAADTRGSSAMPATRSAR
jgi:hypothetical protein